MYEDWQGHCGRVVRLSVWHTLFLIAAIICGSLAPVDSSGMGAIEHEQMWFNCLGVKDIESKVAFRQTLTVFSECIDSVQSFYSDLKTKDNGRYSKFTWGDPATLGHRLLFHWGFSRNPQDSDALRKQVQKAGFSPETENDFYYEVIQEQARRNRAMIDAVETKMFENVSSKRLRGFAAIIYDIHILGDYTTTARDALVPLRYIGDDLYQALITCFDDDGKELALLVRNASRGTNSMDIVKLLQKALPQLIQKAYGNALKKKGIVIEP